MEYTPQFTLVIILIIMILATKDSINEKHVKRNDKRDN